MSGHVTVANFLPIDAFLEIDQNPFQVHLGGHFHKDFSPVPVALDASVEGDFYANPFRFFLGAQGRIEQSVICAPVLGCPDIGSASGAVSSRGAELCGSLFGADLGGYVLWSPFKVGLFFDCSEGFGKVAIARDAAVNGDSSRATVTVSPGHPKVVLEVRGRRAAPRLTLISPGGQHSVDHGTNHLSAGDPVDFVEMPKLDTTLVLIRHAHAGTYTVTSGVGAIASATLHYQSPPISVSARVTGHRRPRTLHYRIRNLVAGASVTFVEQRPDHVLGVARSADGAITFSSADGPGGSRPIVAVLERGGLPQRVIDVTTYVAEPTPPLAAPRRLRATVHGHLLTVTWGGVPGARRYRVVVTFARGAAIVHEVRASADRYATLIPGSASTVSVTVATIGTPAQRGGSAVLTLRNLIRRRPALL